MPPINHNDVKEFIVIGLAGICALAWCGWQYHVIKLALAAKSNRKENREWRDR